MKITITGPRSVGKTTISRIIAKKLKLEFYSSDEIGEKALKKQGGLDKAIKSGKIGKFIKSSAYGLIRKVYEKDNFVFDLSGGAVSSRKYPEASEKVRETANKESIVIGLLPSKSNKQSINFLFKREKERKHFKEIDRAKLFEKVKKDYNKFPPLFKKFCDFIIYTWGKIPDKLAEEIVKKINANTFNEKQSKTLRQITAKNFPKATKILDKEFKTKRVRNNELLFQKFKRYPQFFIGAFIREEIIGIICGFPREDYLLLSELAVDSSYHKKGIGAMLVKAFENTGKNYKEIRAGADDSAIGFYYKCGYSPFLLIQYPKNLYKKEDFSEFKLIESKVVGSENALSLEVSKADTGLLKDLRQRFPKAYFQYIFTKKLKA